MIFTVKHRVKDGSIAEVHIEAANRGECIAKCKVQGIAPVGITVGNSVKKKNYIPNRALLIIFICFVTPLGIYIYQSLSSEKLNKGIRTSKSIQTSSSTIKPQSLKQSIIENRTTAVNKSILKKDTYNGVDVVRREFQTNKTVVIERIYTIDGKRHRKTHYPRPLFSNPSDEYLSWIVGPKNEGSITPLPNLSNENLESDFEVAIKTPIPINEDDSENVKRLKLRVIQAREEMRLLLKNGWTFSDALNEQRKIAMGNADIRTDALNELESILKVGDREGAKDYVRNINLALEQMGIKTLPMPKQLEGNE